MAEQLRQALDEGRLDLTEYDERVQRTYAARTYGDLDGILDDLPGVVPVSASQVVPAGVPAGRQPGQLPRWLGLVWGSWFSASVITTVIWFLGGTDSDFWPRWVIFPWGAVLLIRTIAGLASGAHRAPRTDAPEGPGGETGRTDLRRDLGRDLGRARAERERRRADPRRRY